jgi:uncharacterized protein YcnI
MKTTMLVGVLLLSATPAFAHVAVTPRESKAGATETYTLRVPSEGGKTTTSVVLDVPDGVTILSVMGPEGAKHEEKKSGDRIVQITWTIEIKAGASAQLTFVAKNPPQGDSISWKVHQHYSDSTVSDWVGAVGSRAPAPATKLLPAEALDDRRKP